MVGCACSAKYHDHISVSSPQVDKFSAVTSKNTYPLWINPSAHPKAAGNPTPLPFFVATRGTNSTSSGIYNRPRVPGPFNFPIQSGLPAPSTTSSKMEVLPRRKFTTSSALPVVTEKNIEGPPSTSATESQDTVAFSWATITKKLQNEAPPTIIPEKKVSDAIVMGKTINDSFTISINWKLVPEERLQDVVNISNAYADKCSLVKKRAFGDIKEVIEEMTFREERTRNSVARALKTPDQIYKSINAPL